MNFRNRVATFLSIAVLIGSAVPAFAQMHGSHHFAFVYTAYPPILALIAGILILIFPRILNFIVAIYLIVIGLMGLFMR